MEEKRKPLRLQEEERAYMARVRASLGNQRGESILAERLESEPSCGDWNETMCWQSRCPSVASGGNSSVIDSDWLLPVFR